MQLAPIPAYEYPTNTPGLERSKVPGTSRTECIPVVDIQIHDPEREKVPVSHSPTRRDPEPVPVPRQPTPARTRPFLPSVPARRDPDPVQHVPVSIVHEVTPVQPITHSPGPAPENTKTPAAFVSNRTPTNLSPVSKPNLPNRAQNDNLVDNLAPTSATQKPTQKHQPHVTKPLPEKFRFVGRGVGRDRTFFEVIDLLMFTQQKGDFPSGTTDRMRAYYKRTYPEYFSASKRAAGKRAVNKQKADRLRAENRPRRRKVKPVLHTP